MLICCRCAKADNDGAPRPQLGMQLIQAGLAYNMVSTDSTSTLLRVLSSTKTNSGVQLAGSWDIRLATSQFILNFLSISRSCAANIDTVPGLSIFIAFF